MIAQYYRDPDGILPNSAAIAFTVLGYPLGIALMTQAFWPVKAIGLLLVALTLIWSAYFIHELAHQTIFKTLEANTRWGMAMTWINGSCYAYFADLRRKHMRHHVERADVMTFDVQGFLRRAPAWFRNTVLALEWAYFPAVEFVMRGYVIALPFIRPGAGKSRLRIIAIFGVRTAAFAALGWYSLSALALYAAAYLAMVTVLRFADCFQHTYDAYPILDESPIPNDKLRDRAYEQANTYTNVVGVDSPWLNMLWLNFGYHNAHHARPTVPWYRLPAFHRELFDASDSQVIPVRLLFKSFHTHRVIRVLSADYGEVLPLEAARRADGFVGAVGVSFLTAV
ncbi:MAG: fatty acid desaturase family protein [Herbaspirillum sp.]|nr:fatty acid desaturase family protein [Herbaspirillum sp.]